MLFTVSKLLANVLSPLNDEMHVKPTALIKAFTSTSIELASINLIKVIITDVLQMKHESNK